MLLRKIFNTTLTLFIILTIFSINKTNNIMRVNLEVDNSNINTHIYLLNKDNILVRVDVYLEDGIDNIINYLKIDNNKTPDGLRGYLPSKLKVIDYYLEDDIVTINLSNDIYNSFNMDICIRGIVYSILENNDIKGVRILVEGNKLKGYNDVLNKNMGINNKYLFNSRYNLKKVVVYYIDKINNKDYYVPVTKYINDDRENIEIIIDELKSSNKLISYMSDNTKLINYREEGNVLFLKFNDYLFDSNKDIYNEILNSIAYSIFDNYDVNVVFFENNNYSISR